MKMVTPKTVTDAMLTSSNVAEADYPVWSAVATYASGTKVILTTTYHSVYEAIAASGNLNKHPETAPDKATYWKRVGPTNRWMMFDARASTATTDASAITVVLAPGKITGLALYGVVGDSLSVTVKDAPGGAVVYSKTVDLITRDVYDFTSFCFAPFEYRDQVTLTELPPYYTQELTVSITGTNVQCASMVLGAVTDIGETRKGLALGIRNFSVIKTDEATAVTTFTEKPSAQKQSIPVWVRNTDLERTYKALAAVRGKPAVFIPSDVELYQFLSVLGFYNDFNFVLEHAGHSLLDLQIQAIAS